MRSGALVGLFAILVVSTVMQTSAQNRRKRSNPVHKPGSHANIPLPEMYAERLKDSSQALVVTTSGWNAVSGSLQRYEKHGDKWEPVGDKISIAVGKNGLGWDALAEPAPKGAPVKKEGDGRSPAGIFTIGKAFGFAPSMPEVKLPYRPLTTSIECVDDPSSSSYNQVVDREDIPYPDWNSSEKMRSIDAYKEGVVVKYNDQDVPDAGSCIFLHIWGGPGHGTAGCTAMPEDELTEIMHWLDGAKKPVLIQFPAEIYENVKDAWKLP